MSQLKLQKSNLDLAATKIMGNISMQTSELQGMTFVRVTVHPGGSWSKDLKQIAGTSSCQKGHVGILLSGMLAVQMDDGNKETFNRNDVFIVPPGHDAWCEGNEAAVFVEFIKGTD
jgi:uncharacterized cupin superfamily protein